MATAATSAFAPAERMSHGVHGHTANVRAAPHVPRSTGLTQLQRCLALLQAEAKWQKGSKG